MEERSEIVRLIPAAPGTRIIELWHDDPEQPEIAFEPVIAWAEVADRPGELLPVCDDGEAFEPVLVAPGSVYLGILHPGEELDLDDPEGGWRGRIATWRKEREAQARRAIKAQQQRARP